MTTLTAQQFEDFQTQLFENTGYTFDAFHCVFANVNQRFYNGSLNRLIKNGEISLDYLAAQLMGAGR